jgi:O-antigen ligase
MISMRLANAVDARALPQAPGLLFGLCTLAIVSSLVLGGGTHGGFLSDAILQFLTIPLLLVSFWQLLGLRSDTAVQATPLRWELAFCAALVAVPLVQLVPFPPLIWTALPNRQAVAGAFELLGGRVPWMPISVSPEATWLSAVSLIPPLAIFLGTLLLSYRERRLMSLVVLSIGVVSVFLGLVQVAQGPSSSLRFFTFTNPTEAVGFFANRNHLAALLYALTLLGACWAIDAAFAAAATWDRRRYDGPAIVVLVASFTLLIILVSAQAMARSRAGLALTMLAVFAAFALVYSDRRATGDDPRALSRVTPAKLLLFATTLAILFSVQFTLYRVMERFGSDPLEDGRISFARSTIEAARAYMPFGSGVGTFVPVYGMFEKPQDAMINAYANHAHDDILEAWLETGVLGIALMGLFAAWLARRSVTAWRRAPPGMREIDLLLARAATVIVVLLLLHSSVDYPLRTSAMMAVFAFACALLVDPTGEPDSEPRGHRQNVRQTERVGQRETPGQRERVTQNQLRHAADNPAPPLLPVGRVAGGAAIPSPKFGELWGKDVEWPEAWRKPTKPQPSTATNSEKPIGSRGE